MYTYHQRDICLLEIENKFVYKFVVFDSIECIFTVLFICAAPAEASSRVRTSSRGTFCSWQFDAVILNASRGSFKISSYNIANIFLSGIELSFVSLALYYYH